MKHIQEIPIKKTASFNLENGLNVRCQAQGTLKLASSSFPFKGDFVISFDFSSFEIAYINNSFPDISDEEHEKYVLEAWVIFNNESFSDLEVL